MGLDAALAVDALRRGSALPVDALRGQVQVDLGSLGGARLGFADATALPDGRVAFIASSEGNDGTNDGVIYGSVVGMLDSDLRVTTLRPLTGLARKVEGIELATRLEKAASPSSFVLVTDPDDPAKPTELLSVDLA